MHEPSVRMFTSLIVVLFAVVCGSVAQTTEPSNVLPYLNPSLPMNELLMTSCPG